MSEADVDLVRTLVPGPEVDWAAVVRNEGQTRQLEVASGALFEPDFPCCISSVGENWLSGLSGLWEIWREWLEPWTSYHVFEEEIVDLGGGRVIWMGRDVGGSPGGDVTLLSSAIWTVTDGKISSAVFYTRRDSALEAAGLEAEPR